jgi:hypothetical protein
MAFKFLCFSFIIFLCGFFWSFFFYEHMPRRLVYRAIFCANSFSHFALFFGGFLADDTHILDPTHVIFFVFDHFAFQLAFEGLFVQLHKCLALAPSGLPLGFILPIGFCCPLDGIRILGVPCASTSFAFSFLQKALGEDV